MSQSRLGSNFFFFLIEDWAALIIEMMMYVGRQGSNLGYPRLIHQLCLASEVTFLATDICDKEPLPFSKRMINQSKGHLSKESPPKSTTAGCSSSRNHKGKTPKEQDSEVMSVSKKKKECEHFQVNNEAD